MSFQKKMLTIFNFFTKKDINSIEHSYQYTTENNGYIIEDNGYILTFKKNGIIHREVGPAVFWTKNKKTKKYLGLEDRHLYKIKIKELSTKEHDFWRISMFQGDMDDVSYYLNGVSYSKEEFDKLLEWKTLSEQLQQELPTRKHLTKKLKV